MKVLNSGKSVIRLSTGGKFTVLNQNDCIEMDERTFKALHSLFPALIPAVETKETIIEAKPQPITKKGRKNGTSKKSK